jgi:hypothetical protein
MGNAARRLSALAESLLAALCYFDVFGYPLTSLELRRFRQLPVGGFETDEPSMGDVRAAAGEMLSAGLVGTRDGYWFLAGREGTVAERQRRFRLTEPKYRRARLVARLISRLPSVRLVAVCNSLSWDYADESSDIDFFVAVRPGTVWASRFLVAGVLAALGLRPDDQTHADRICLSFLVAETNLDLSRIAVSPDDPYLRYWAATIVPLFDPDGLAERFREANGWAFGRLPGAWTVRTGHRRLVRGKGWEWLMPVLRLLEKPSRRFQMRRFPAAITGQANLSGGVLVSDDILKFHVRDERRRFQREYAERLRRFGLD